MVWEFIKELAKGVFSSYSSVTTLLSFVVFIFWLLLPKLKVEGRMKVTKKTLGAIPWSYRLLTVLGLLFVSVILTSYSMYNDAHQDINAKKEQITGLLTQLDVEHKNSKPSTLMFTGGIGYNDGTVTNSNIRDINVIINNK